MLYYLSGLYGFSDALSVGLSYFDQDASGVITLKGECQLGKGALSLSYAMSTISGSTGGIVGLGYEVGF